MIVSGGPCAWRCVPVAVLTLFVFVALAGPSAATDDPVILAVERAQAELARAGSEVAELTSLLEDLREERVALDRERGSLSADERALTDHQRDLEGLARRYVVQAYIGGRETGLEDGLMNPAAAGESAYRNYLVRDHAGRTRQVLHDQLEQRGRVDQRVSDLARALDRNAAETAQAEIDLDRAHRRWQQADQDLRAAEHDAALLASVLGDAHALGFVASGGDGGPTPEQSGNAAGPGWAALRQCEAGGNYAAVSPSGQYRGAYQFDLITWRGVGGVGDPAAAPPAEQDYRAQLLYNQRGAQPWPVCGRYLLADKSLRPIAAVPPPAGLPSHPVAAPLPTNQPPPSTAAPTTAPPVTTPPPTPPPTTAPPATTTTTVPTTTSTAPAPIP